MSGTPFHADELAVQARAGVSPRGVGIRDLMPEQHRTFFQSLSQVFVSSADSEGWPIATVLEGEPGFISSRDPAALRIDALPGAGDPSAGTLHVGQEIGILGIDLATRRRNRANGVVSELDATGFSVAVKQSFGNCPQYIQRRALQRVQPLQAPAEALVLPDDRARSLIERADTFFVATRSRAAVGAAGGADISHRGGRPGFVRLDGDTLWIPDFKGNRYFNTLGNIVGEPRASLLFLDFESGNVLQLKGLASIEWDGTGTSQVEGAERLWCFKIVQGWLRAQASAHRGTLIDYSPTTLRTGTWPGSRSGASVATCSDAGDVNSCSEPAVHDARGSPR